MGVDGGVVGLVLAGGEGRRWGGPKAWARLPDGRTFLAACAGALAGGGASRVVATLPPGRARGPVPDRVLPLALDAAGLDMFASLRRGLLAAVELGEWETIVVLPVDHPLVGPTTVAAVAALAIPAAIATVAGKHGHPVGLSRALAELVAWGWHRGPTLREVLRDARAADAPVDDPGVRANCNTPERLAEAWTEANRREVARDDLRG